MSAAANNNGDAKTVQQFYDPLSSSYDAMTDFDSRLLTAEGFVRNLAGRFSFRRAVDIACGTGVFTIALAKAGVWTIGTDISTGMVREAAIRARASEADVGFVVSSMEALGVVAEGEFDLVLCMGNSLPHILDPGVLERVFASFRKRIRPGGHFLGQVLNYSKLLERRERIVEINRQGPRDFIRFYDFLQSHVRFNLLTVEWKKSGPVHDLQSVRLYPYRDAELVAAAESAGFSDIALYGGLDFSPYEPRTSSVLVFDAECSTA